MFAQDGVTVNQTEGPSRKPYQKLQFYSGTDLEYVCYAGSHNTTATWARSDNSLTSIAVSTNTATATTAADHGITVDASITVSGATVDTDLNGTYVVLTVATPTTFTFTTASVGDATYTEATLQFTHTGARDTEAIWSIQKFVYASNKVIKSGWANGSTALVRVCASRATYEYR
jgi:hypothetical protein